MRRPDMNGNERRFRNLLTALGCLWLLLAPQLNAQDDLVAWINYTVEDGLPSMEIYDLMQDRNGFIWLATSAGLCRYDGYSFETYTTQDGLPGNDIIELEEDAQGRIWISSLGPLSYFEHDSFSVVDTGRSFHQALSGFNLVSLSNGYVWMNIGAEVKLMNPNNQFEKPSVGYILGTTFARNRIFPVSADRVGIATKDTIFLLDKHRVIDRIPSACLITSGKDFASIFHQNSIYYTSTCGLVHYNRDTRCHNIVDAAMTVAVRMSIIDNELWIFGGGPGVVKRTILEGGKLGPPQIVFRQQFVNNAIKDREGNYWFSTAGGGLFFKPKMSTPGRVLEIISSDGRVQQIESILSQPDGVWLGTRTGKLMRYNLNNQKQEEYQIFNRLGQANRILDIQQLPNNRLALATDCGLFAFGEGKYHLLTIVPTKRLAQGGNGDLLLSTQRGVYRFPADLVSQNHNFDDQPGNQGLIPFMISPNRSYSVYEDAEGRYWFDDILNGLTSIQGTDTIYWASRSSVFKSRINTINSLGTNIMVFSTEGEGIVFVKGNQIWPVNTEAGMPSNICKRLIVDEQTIWVGTNRGLVKIQNVDFDRRQISLSVLKKTDGLISEDINALALHHNELIIGTYKGLMVIKKQVFLSDKYQPTVYITQVLAGDREVHKLAQPVTLRPDENFIAISFVGISFKSGGKLRYRYRLEGHDERWITTANVEARYSNLHPGDYVFKVYGISQSGVESPQPAVFRFTVRPYFTQTRIFKILGILGIVTLIAFLGYGFHAFRQRRILQRLVQEKTKALNERLQELAELNNKLERSNFELQQFAHVASHDLKSPLRNVASFMQLLDRRLKDRLQPAEKEYIEYAIKGAKDMEQIINDLLAMSKVDQLDAEKEWINTTELIREILRDLQADVQEKQALIDINPGLPSILYSRTNAKQVFQNLITNGLKYQADGNVPVLSIGAIATGNQWTFFVKDNGIGIEDKYQDKVFELFQRLHTRYEYAGTGIGLAICKKIIEKNGGKIWFESMPDEGTTFYFTITNHAEPSDESAA